MNRLRLPSIRRRGLALWLIAATLLVKALVPPGYMPVATRDAVTIALCSGYGPERMAPAMPGMDHRRDGHPDRPDHHSADDSPCGFAGHAPAPLAGADPILLPAGFAPPVVAAAGAAPIAAPPRRLAFLRPPLRGPPTIG